MFTALVSAATSTTPGFLRNVLFLIVVLTIAIPLGRKLRKSVSKSRKQRWVKEGLMDPPDEGPDADKRSD